MELLGVESLSHNFNYPLFENLNLSLKAKDCIAIQGSSDCGKSALLRILSSFLKPDSDIVSYQNQNLYDLNESKRLKIRRRDFDIIFQVRYLFKGPSALKNIELASVLSKQDLDKGLLKKLGIDMLLDQKIGKLSGGQQQGVNIAGVLCRKPRIIFADETTGSLDFASAQNVLRILMNYVKKDDTALFFITHDDTLASLRDKAYILKASEVR